jgi:hypothetical protein
MLWVPQKGVLRVEHNVGSVGTDTPGTSVTTGGAASTKGTPVEVFASTSFDTCYIAIMASNYGASVAASAGCLDILVGAATEEVLIPNLLMGYSGAWGGSFTQNPKQWEFPLYIPAGSRIAVQTAGERVTTASRVQIYLYGGMISPAWRVGSHVTTYGIGTVPNGTSITPGASGGEGAWAQITASTTEDHFALVPSFQPSADTTTSTRTYAVDIGIGAATEEMIQEGYIYGVDGNEKMCGPMPCIPCYQDIPSGSRLVMRASNSGTNDGAYNGALHAVS